MAENRNIQYPGQPPGNFGMMPNPGMPQFQPPSGIQMVPMMHSGMMVPPGTRMMPQQAMMFPVQPLGMRPPAGPGIAPPSYTQHMADKFNNRPSHGRQGVQSAEQRKRVEEKIKKEKQFLAQKQKLQAFGRIGPVDEDKFSQGLMESMFGKVEKSKSKAIPTTIQPGMEDDDGFGDFMVGPHFSVLETVPVAVSSTPQSMAMSQPVTTPETLSELSGDGGELQTQTKEERKDLMSMMMECSDLTAPNKAKTFHRPALKELPPSHHGHHHTFHQSQQARQWTQPADDLSQLFKIEPTSQMAVAPEDTPEPPGGQTSTFELPVWCKDEDRIPAVYKQVLDATLENEQILTERLYPILLMSGLAKDTLGQIWNLANRTTPGQLIKEELYLMLALIAFAQNNYKALTMDMLNNCPHPPVPFLGQQGQNPPTAAPQQMAPSGQSGAPLQQGLQMPDTNPVIGQIGGVDTINTSTDVPPHGGDDDFADFQAAGLSVSTEPPVVKPPVRPRRRPEPEYLYEVPTPAQAEKMAGPMTSDMAYSNVSNFFGSDESSGPSTPNSLEADFDDFKSADSKPSDSSQFSSEQSENEDFKVFESYLEDFERRKQVQQESPLHRPVSKSSLPLPSMPPAAAPVAIPAVRNLWSKPPAGGTHVPLKLQENASQFHMPDLVVADSARSSDSDFADFQQAPGVNDFSKSAVSKLAVSSDQLKSTGSDVSLTLIGDEDKYAALRSLEFGSEVTAETVNVDASVSTEVVADDDENWADFQTAGLEAPQSESVVTVAEDSNSAKENILSLFNKASLITSSEQPMGDTVTNTQPLSLDDNVDSDWTEFGANTAVTVEGPSDWTGFTPVQTSRNIAAGSSGIFPISEQKDEKCDDWADFQGPEDVCNTPNSALTDKSSGAQDPAALVSVKKTGLQSQEILGLFKVREPCELPSDLKVVYTENTVINSEWNPELAASTNKIPDSGPTLPAHKVFSVKSKKRLPSFGPDDEEDSFRVPPPMDDDHGEDDIGEFSRGYEEMEDYHQPKNVLDEKKRMKYNLPGMGVVSKPVVKASKSSSAQDRYVDIMMLDETDVDQGLSKDIRDICGQDKLSVTKSEDSQSVSSLELPFPSKNRLQNIQDQDTQSISSNEYSNFDSIPSRKLGTPVNMESKSVDSLDLKTDEDGGEDQMSGDRSREDSPAKVEEGISTEDMLNSDRYTGLSNLPVLGDRYSGILHDIPGSDKHAYEWQRCLDNSYRMIKDANNIFNSISSSAVCNEVLKSEQGSEYVQGVVEIFRVVCRITTAMKASALTTDKLQQLLKEIDLSWNNLTAFLVGGNFMPDDNSLHFKTAVLKSDDPLSQRKACGVCLLNVDVPNKNIAHDEEYAKLTYGGRQYHAACANFWVNCVDSMLPALKLPDLL